MSRSTDNTLERLHPEMKAMTTVAKGDLTAAMAVSDATQELYNDYGTAPEEYTDPDIDVKQFGSMMLSCFKPGKKYWLEGAIWIYIGKCIHVGHDFIVLRDAVRVPVDGRHSLFMKQGPRAAGIEGLEIEPTGSADFGIVYVSCDWWGFSCEWQHEIPKEAI